MLPAVPSQPQRSLRRSAAVAIALSAAVLLAGCQNKASIGGGDPLTTGSTSAPDDKLSFKKTDQLAAAWNKDQGNAAIGMAYADNLQKFGQQQNAAQVLQKVSSANAANGDVQARIGKSFLAMGDFPNAATTLERAVTVKPQDWQSLSALGSAYDQLSRHGEARDRYKQALALKPDAVAVRNNYAMSFALQGQLPDAEKMLRELMNTTGADAPRVRQNLALVVGLQGRFDEARKIASEDLPPDEVEANLAYLQQMLSQPNTWKQLQDPGQG